MCSHVNCVLIGWLVCFGLESPVTKVSAKSPFVNTDLRQNLAETKVSTLRPHLSLRPG